MCRKSVSTLSDRWSVELKFAKVVSAVLGGGWLTLRWIMVLSILKVLKNCWNYGLQDQRETLSSVTYVKYQGKTVVNKFSLLLTHRKFEIFTCDWKWPFAGKVALYINKCLFTFTFILIQNMKKQRFERLF